MSNGRALCWLRRDLRLHDHGALQLATANANWVSTVFVYDSVILGALKDRSDRRVTFIHQSVGEVAAGLQAAGSDLIERHGDPVQEIPALAAELGVKAVYASHDDDPYALARDETVRNLLAQQGIEFVIVKDHVVKERREVLSGIGEPFRVFTPYSKAWKAALTPEDLAERVPDFERLAPVADLPSARRVTMDDIGFEPSDLWLEAGEKAARARLQEFLSHVSKYGEQRDFPAIRGTSGLSVHLRFGTISVRECVRVVIDNPAPGAAKWLAELIWREFYQMILACFPHVVDSTFRPEYNDLEWSGTEDQFKAWCEGRTGYPLVDAAMRCFNATGWMHNRLRMVVAMFLTKDLLCDYRWGEEYFAERLLDFDLASNNGGWQWSASTGVDAQPYFRVFNPILQSRKFDPDAVFIKKWVPELSEASDPHWPHEGLFAPPGYVEPIVDHFRQKDLAIQMFSSRKAPE